MTPRLSLEIACELQLQRIRHGLPSVPAMPVKRARVTRRRRSLSYADWRESVSLLLSFGAPKRRRKSWVLSR